jgi:hypothetical protein
MVWSAQLETFRQKAPKQLLMMTRRLSSDNAPPVRRICAAGWLERFRYQRASVNSRQKARAKGLARDHRERYWVIDSASCGRQLPSDGAGQRIRQGRGRYLASHSAECIYKVVSSNRCVACSLSPVDCIYKTRSPITSYI